MMKKIIITSIIFIFLFEAISFISTKLNLLIYNNDPNYIHSFGNKWRTEVDPWGSWHKPNYADKHSSACFEVSYKSNNIGARDEIDYQVDDEQNSIILLGDSFAEGYGVNFENTFKQRLENKIQNKKVLNFGSAGHFGPLQAQILYNDLASKYKHDELIYLFFPYNDFRDNDWDYWKTKVRKFRNRPYFLKTSDKNEYEVYYPNNKTNTLLLKIKNFIFNDFQGFLLKYTYSANTLRTINYIYSNYNLSETRNQKNNKLNQNFSYNINNQNSVLGSIYSINKIFSANNYLKKKIIVIIPTLKDIKHTQYDKSYKELLWYKELKNISEKNNIFLIDLADYVDEDRYIKMIYSCDMHWNPEGHEFVADLIFDKYYSN